MKLLPASRKATKTRPVQHLRCFGVLSLFFLGNTAIAQIDSLNVFKDMLDSIYIQTIEEVPGEKPKILHAEPLYIDLIRDLGARKGEREWNIGLGMFDGRRYSEYEALVEYEWAPIDRLGLEIEVPVALYQPGSTDVSKDSIPGDKIESLKLAAQWSFLVYEPWKMTLALGYLHEFELTELRNYRSHPIYEGNIYNPFFIAAKRWGQNYHTLVYAGPQFFHNIRNGEFNTLWQINTNLHYMIDGTRNFIGIEFNKEVYDGRFEMTVRPQMRVGLADNLLIGIVTGIPVNRTNERLSSFVRLIYEPSHSLH